MSNLITFFDGNMTRDPELKNVGGSSLATTSIAVNQGYYNNNKEWVEKVTFVNIEAWGKTAEKLNTEGAKGYRIIGDGEFYQNSWEDNNGNKRYDLKLRINKIRAILPPKAKNNEPSGSGTYHGDNKTANATQKTFGEQQSQFTDDGIPF